MHSLETIDEAWHNETDPERDEFVLLRAVFAVSIGGVHDRPVGSGGSGEHQIGFDSG